MARKARIVIPQIPHHITQRGNNKAQMFFEERDKLFFLSQLYRYSHKYELKIISYCLMDNHTHLLAIPLNKWALADCLKSLHLVYSQYINKKLIKTGINWQGRFHSSPMDDEYSWYAVQYVVLNPVKAGIVKRPQDYVWSSARYHLYGTKSSILSADKKWLNMATRATTEICLKPKSKENLEAFDIISHNTKRNLPIGDVSFC